MWQLGFTNNLFIAKGGVLGPSEVEWDNNSGCFMPKKPLVPHEDFSDDDELYCASDTSFDSDSDDLDQFTEEDYDLCARVPANVGGGALYVKDRITCSVPLLS
jgi:hypothetical protein